MLGQGVRARAGNCGKEVLCERGDVGTLIGWGRRERARRGLMEVIAKAVWYYALVVVTDFLVSL